MALASERLRREREEALLDQGRAPRAAEHEPCGDGQLVAPGEDALALPVERQG
jgi:hypothetical protein